MSTNLGSWVCRQRRPFTMIRPQRSHPLSQCMPMKASPFHHAQGIMNAVENIPLSKDSRWAYTSIAHKLTKTNTSGPAWAPHWRCAPHWRYAPHWRLRHTWPLCPNWPRCPSYSTSRTWERDPHPLLDRELHRGTEFLIYSEEKSQNEERSCKIAGVTLLHFLKVFIHIAN